MVGLSRQRSVQASVVIAALLLVVTIGSVTQAGAKEYANASLLLLGQELTDRLGDEGLRILDARPPERYAASHIPDAVNVPIADITRAIDGVPGMLAPVEEVKRSPGQLGVTRETQVVIYDDFGGIQATRLFWALDYLGHPRLSVLQGGFDLWQHEGRPTSQEVPPVKTSRYRGELRADRLADRSWVQTRINDTAIALVDARSSEEFRGEVPGREVTRAGDIPGAVNVDWVRNLTTTEPRQFKLAAELAALSRQARVTPEKEIAVYCRTGAQASHDYFVLRLLGYPRVRVYDGSYVEWAADDTLPVAR